MPKRVHTGCMGNPTLAGKDLWKKKRGDLNDKRNSLFEKYSRNPHDLELALEIKKIDDEIAEYTDMMRRENLSERKTKLLPAVAPAKN
jgi:phage host-nuclease inhibitor protein Gam